MEAHSISSGIVYPAWVPNILSERMAARYVSIDDDEARRPLSLCRREGIIPDMASSHDSPSA
jgi:tryptophan synthase beta subunit